MELLRKYFLELDVEEIVKIKPSTSHDGDVLAWGPDADTSPTYL
jgi:hypothetical protein